MRSLTCLLICAFLWGNSASAEQSLASQLTFQEGLKQYQAGRYILAVDHLSRAASMDKSNPQIHYYLANALVFTGEHDRAANEYYACYVLDPEGKLANYCLQALSAYKKPIADRRTIDYQRTSLINNNRKNIVYTSAAKNNVQDADVGRAFTVIRRQVSFEKSKNKAIGDSKAKVAVGIGDEESRRISENAQAEIDKLYEPLIYPGPRINPLLNNPELLKARADEIRRNAEEAQVIAKKKAQMRAESYKEWIKTKEVALEEVADNLESQLGSPKVRDGVQLQPVGTDLYVRYYGSSNRQEVFPEVRPAVARIFGQKLNTDSVNKSSPGDTNSFSNKSVTGKILEK